MSSHLSIIVMTTVTVDLLPNKSRTKYEREYFDFEQWLKSKDVPVDREPSEESLLAYLQEIGRKYKPTTLWSKYSMLNACMKSNWGKDLKTAPRLTLFLKKI